MNILSTRKDAIPSEGKNTETPAGKTA